jgi:two-component system, NarL family, invasion response regulator UvrY
MIENKRTRVLSVDDSADLAELTQRILSREDDIIGVGSLPSAADLADHASRLHADVVLLDLGMPGPDPLDAAKRLCERSDCRVIILSGRDDPATIDAAFDAGVSGFIGKDTNIKQLIDAVRTVAAGGMWLPARGW